MRCGWILLPLLVSACAGQPPADPNVVTLPPGLTSLGEIGRFRVGWQSYGQPAEYMPDGWVGHFEERTGVSYNLGDSVLGREAVLMHSPWRVPPGRTCVEFRLRLPRATPITFTTGITMNPYSMEPEHSDGVTFSAYLVDGAEKQLFREHYAKAEWKDLTFDLSASAGRDVTLRLQVEPGPANSPSFDFSYWSRPVIQCGTTTGPGEDRVARLLAKPAYRAVAGRSLVTLANRPGEAQGIAPSTFLPAETSVSAQGGTFWLRSKAADASVAYIWQPATGTLDDITAKVDDGTELHPCAGGGVTFAVGDKLVSGRGGRCTASSVDANGRTVRIEWQYPAEQGGATVVWTLGIVGRALTVRAECAQPKVAGLSLGQVTGAALRRRLAVPYLLGNLDYLPADALYSGRYLDWTVSHASTCPQGEASYHALTDGTRNTLLESGYVTLTPHVAEALPNLPHPVSPYVALLGPKVMLDIWGHRDNTYAGDARLLRELKDNGVDHVAIIQHDWQRWGYDAKLPDHLPANPAYGGDPAMIEFGRAARDCGYVWSLHENYIDLYPDAPSYDPAARVLQSDGKPSPAWYNSGTKVQSYGLKSNRALGYAKAVAPEAHRRYGTNAAYLDVHTCVPPWHQLDHEAGQPLAGMALAKVKNDTALFQFMRDSHEGPMFGEGNNQFYWAGRCDGVEAQVEGGEDHRPFLDFDLLRLHPQMVNHGMGYYERWFRQGYDANFGQNVGTPVDMDRYRAQEVAYGHAGFIGNALTGNVNHVVKEHHLMHAVQALSGTAKVTAIEYGVGDRFVDASIALAVTDTRRQRIRYHSGLTVWVNWAEQPWTVDGHTLPQWGWRAAGPGTEVATELRDGKVADTALTPEYTYVDARTWFPAPYVNRPRDIEPKLRSLKDLGDGRVEITYEWKVGEKLSEDYNCFVHFNNVAADQWGGDDIVFQHDHALPRPTSAWQPGETIVDGPHILTVPAGKYNSYDVTIGLWKTGRLNLKGIRATRERILIGRLGVKQEGGKVVAVTSLPVTAADDAIGKTPDWDERVYPAATTVTCGDVRTNGSVKLVKESARRWVVYPYPRDRAFQIGLKVAPTAKVAALAALTGAELGAVPAKTDGGWLTFDAGKVGAGRYVVTW
ncbi:MAG: hypothetical protein HZB16_15410 [Armatimonadetes bacterium]|nr:hypothetical protein [Armatimonadota bacterium]